MRYKILSACILVILISLFRVVPVAAQETPAEDPKIVIPSSVKEEIHRYMGYEELLPKYVSLPYDVTMNTNVRGPYLDIGFMFLLFLPILLVLGLKDKLLKFIVGLLMIFFLVLSSSNSYSSVRSIQKSQVAQNLQSELDTITFGQAPISYLKLKMTQANHAIYQELDRSMIQQYSGEGDYITYPIFFILFIVTFFLLTKRIGHKPKGEQALVYLGLLYGFLWVILGAGIPWYGILMLALGFVFMAVGFLGETSAIAEFKYAKYLFVFGTLVWFTMSFNYRMVNFQPFEEHGRAGAIHITPLFYGLGKKNKEEVLDELFPAYRSVLNEVNSDPDALVYRVGTFFQYFIDRNHERVTHDNQLGFFSRLSGAIPNKVTLAKALKKAGYRYLLIDVNTASIDDTPEQSLVRKVKKLNTFLVNNPMLEPIGTDRIIQLPNGQYTFGFSGGEVKSVGSFIAFKIK